MRPCLLLLALLVAAVPAARCNDTDWNSLLGPAFAEARQTATEEVLEALTDTSGAFQKFIERYNKTYSATSMEGRTRRAYFFQNLQSMLDINTKSTSGILSFYAGINEYSDLSSSDFKKLLGLTGVVLSRQGQEDSTATVGRRLSSSQDHEEEGPSRVLLQSSTGSVDWRPYFPAIKNQGVCGSCWSFATTAAIENVQAIMSGSPPRALSEQQLIDCDSVNKGCDGGDPGRAFQYVIGNGGITSFNNYPYKGSKGVCSPTESKQFHAKISGFAYVKQAQEAAFKAALDKQALAGAVYADSTSFQNYKGGVFNDFAGCVGDINHAIIIAGYNDTGKYWIIRNSWGKSWGMDGYMYLAMGTSNRGVSYPSGACSILDYALYPQMNAGSVLRVADDPAVVVSDGSAGLAAVSFLLAALLSVVAVLASSFWA